MGFINFLTTPIYLFILFGLAYYIRPRVTNSETSKYFIPALSAKFIGAISLGLIYQFYYGGGDTIAAYHNGGAQIWKAFLESPLIAFQLLTAGKEYEGDTFAYASRIFSYGDLPTYFIVRVAGFFSLFTLNSYYANALLFATISFSGSWALFHAFHKLHPHLTKKTAIIVLFIPSVVFWGSGILKDTITFAAVGWLFYAFSNVFLQKKASTMNIIILIVSGAIILHIKIYIALCLFPSLIILFITNRNKKIKNKLVRVLVAPILLILAGALSYQSVSYLGSINRLYSIDQFAHRAQVTAEWLRFVSNKQGGSYYSLGDSDDFTNAGLARNFIPAVMVTLFRPYLWEVKNPVMLLSALESLAALFFCIYIIYNAGLHNVVDKIMSNPMVFSFLFFSVLFSFAIGASTYNFGSLVRYKIPMIPFFLMALLLLNDKNILSRKK
ncbi:MAG: hypothetical protein ACJASM_001665 [Salibacteraceae bacterium]